MKVKTNHPFTKPQLEALQAELNKISDIKIINLKGLPGKEGFSEIELKHSPYSLDVFLLFIENKGENFKSYVYKIDINGLVDYNVRQNMEFETLSDRVHFFNTLENIILE